MKKTLLVLSALIILTGCTILLLFF
ncbi:lipoprotein, partial [Desulfobulbus sp. US4]|nr:lipoprotein [Desulfobulbus sp. US4]